MTDAQIKQILLSMKESNGTYEYETTDREIYTRLNEVAPYVIGYKRGVRQFSCKGISELGKTLIG